LLTSCGAGESKQRPGRIILVSMDTVRADRVGLSGPPGATPEITRIAREGVSFRRFVAASNYTLPSHMTLFTGLDPAEHGVYRGATRLNPQLTTLAESLAAAGYRTQGFHEGG
jgi:arylsulfatase A